MSYRGKPCQITWGAAFGNVLAIGYALDEAVSYPVPREGSEWAQCDSGEEDGWIVGTDQMLEGMVRWIPRVTGVTPEGRNATGWDGPTGWREFLTHARGKNIYRFYPDMIDAPAVYKECYLVAPLTERPEPEDDYSRKLRLVQRTADGSVWEGY